MLISADWVLPGLRRPIRDGAVLISDGHVVEIGPLDELAGLPYSGDHHHFEGAIITPGLVNAHTHLSLSAMRGLLQPSRFEEWLPRLVTAMRGWTHDDYAASAAFGAQTALLTGTTVVGDIAYGPESSAAAADHGLGGVFYWEVLGIPPEDLYAELQHREFPHADQGLCSRRIRCGISPHSAYTSEPALLKAVSAAAAELDAPVAIHVAESAAEVELIRAGTGPLAATAARLAPGFSPTGDGPVAYLDHLGVLDNATAVHLCQILPTDVPRLAATVRGAVTCPRSNRFLSNRVPPVSRLLAAGVPVGVGTDSSASNTDIDLMSEVRALQDADPSLTPTQLIQLITTMGAIALGCEDRFGMLEPGMEADLSIFDLGRTGSPEADFVARAGSDTLRAVISAGQWRVVDGRLVDRERAARIERQAADAAEKALAAIEAGPGES